MSLCGGNSPRTCSNLQRRVTWEGHVGEDAFPIVSRRPRKHSTLLWCGDNDDYDVQITCCLSFSWCTQLSLSLSLSLSLLMFSLRQTVRIQHASSQLRLRNKLTKRQSCSPASPALSKNVTIYVYLEMLIIISLLLIINNNKLCGGRHNMPRSLWPWPLTLKVT